MKKILCAITVVATAATATTAFAHAKLEKSEPENGSIVATSPSVLKLHYNEPVEAVMSSVKFIGTSGTVVPAGKPALDQGDDKTLIVSVPVLPAGEYRAEWSTMGHDGHHTKGEVRFTVK